MKPVPNLGDQEMLILTYVNEHAPISVREAATYFEKEKNLARTTVLTVMERLRKKGFLSRSKVDGVFKYAVKFEQEKVLHQTVSNFVERTLGGSVSPLFSYFAEKSNLTKDELEQLRKIADRIEKMEGK